MNRKEKIKYWVDSSNYDWKVACHLLTSGDYPYALFLGHLSIEKLLKALFSSQFDETPPFTHKLVYLAEKIGLELSPEKIEMLEIITDFHLEARYPDEKFSFFKQCTKKFAQTNMKNIKEIRKWLLEKIR